MAAKILNHLKVKIVFKYNLLFAFLLMLSLSLPVLAETKPSKIINLTAEERQWIKDHPVVKFTGDPNWLPYEAFDNNGNYVGIVSEYLKIISSESGLQFKMSPSKSWIESVNKAKSGEVDVLSETDDSDLKSHLSFTIPYMSNPIVIVMRNNENYTENINVIKNKKIALIKDYGYASKIRRKHSNINFITVADIQEGLISISTGKNDALLCTLALCSYTISELGLNNVKITGKSEFDTKLALGVQKNLPILHSILNKSIKLVSHEQQQVILSHWIKNKTTIFKDYSLVIKVSIVFAIVFIIFVFWNRRLSYEINLRLGTEKALQHERDFADSLLKTAPVIVLLLDLEGNIEYVNPYFENLSGFQLDEIKGKEWIASFLPKRDHSKIRELLKSSVEQKAVCGNVNAIVIRNGEEREIEWYAETMQDEQGNVSGVLSIGQDVTEKKQAELALLKSEAGLNEAQRLAKVGSWDLDLLTSSLTWSDEIYHIFEIDKEKFTATYDAFLNVIHPEDRDKVNKAYTDSLSNRLPYKIKHRLLMNDGSIKYVVESCETFFDAEGNPLRSVGTVQDISELNKAEIEMELSQIRFEAMFESIPDAVVYADPERNIRMVNQAAISLFGFNKDELFGNKTKMIYASEDDFKQQGVKRYNPESKNTATPNVITYKNKDGREFPGETLGTAVKSSSGEVLGYLGIIRDITERTLLEEELDSYHDSLEAQIEIRTADLIKSRDEAERANKAKSDFLSSMSHELRTPLNAILGFGQMLEMSSSTLSDIQNSNIQDILDAGHHLLKLINQVLNLAQIESGKTELSIEKTDVSEILYECKHLISSSIEKRNIEFIDNVSEHQYLVMADFMRLKQVFLNLLNNAVKYNISSGRLIIDSQKVNRHHIRICVTDTGQGLTDNEISRLFNPFERLNVKSNVEGTGIGLTITKHLIELMGGEIGVESTLGKGSTFWIELKCAK